jgi:hypothetical protein
MGETYRSHRRCMYVVCPRGLTSRFIMGGVLGFLLPQELFRYVYAVRRQDEKI